MNPPRRRRRHRYNAPRRRYRRNPDGVTTGFLWDATYVTGGFFVTRMAANMVLPMIPMAAGFPSVRILSKGVVAWLVGWGGGMLLGRRAGMLLMTGGFVETLSDAVRTYVTPFFPMLAQDDLGAYPQLPMGVYPGLGYDYSNPYNVEMGQEEHESAGV